MTGKAPNHTSTHQRHPHHDALPGQMRKDPHQARATLTIQIIFEAAAQIIQSDGLAGLSTNRVAEHAGYAVGTVYQYFHNKESLLLAMAMHELDAAALATHEVMQKADACGLDDTLRAVVQVWLQVFGGRHRVQRLVMQSVMAHGAYTQFHDRIVEVATSLGEKLATLAVNGGQPLGAACQFVMTRALLGVMRSAVLEDVELLQHPALEDELVRMMTGMLHHTGP